MQRMLLRLATLLALTGALVIMSSPLALAHVDLAASVPSEGTAVTGPVESIQLTFTEAARPAGDGIQLLVAPDTPVQVTVEQVSSTVVSVIPNEPLEAGSYAVGWSVQAGDAHPRTGVVTFSVVAAAVPESAPDQTPRDEAIADAAAETPPASTTSGDDGDPIEAFASLAVDENTTFADWMGRLARWVGLGGALFGIGALAFGAAISLNSEHESRYAAYWTRRGGLAVLLSIPFELVAQSTLLNGGSITEGFRIESFSSVLGGPFGWALLLRAAGGAGLMWGTSLGTSAVQESQPVPAGPRLSGVGTRVAVRAAHRLDLSLSALAVLGSLVLVLSYLFDGHTVTASPAFLVRAADFVHVGAGAVWVGGVGLLALTLTRRHAAGTALEAGPLVIRFSTLATLALVAVGIAGAVMAWSILDGFGELFSTGWGRALLAKLALVGIAAGFGAFNHFVVLPQLMDPSHDERIAHLTRRATSVEAVVLMAVIGLTAVLVGSAS